MRALTVLTLVVFGCAGASGEAKPRPSSASESGRKLACSLPKDCAAGSQCCTTPLWDGTYCTARCDLANNGRVCAGDSDCPEIGGAKTHCLPVSPEDTPGLPASLAVCQ